MKSNGITTKEGRKIVDASFARELNEQAEGAMHLKHYEEILASIERIARQSGKQYFHYLEELPKKECDKLIHMLQKLDFKVKLVASLGIPFGNKTHLQISW